MDDVADFVGFEAGLFEDVVEGAAAGDLDEVEVGVGVVLGGQPDGADRADSNRGAGEVS